MSEENQIVQKPSFDVATFELVQRRAKAYSESSLVPKEYQKNISNCIVAIEIASRVGSSELMVMQNLYIVHGRPAWSSQYIIAAMNSCGRFKPLDFDMSGEGDDYGCVAWTETKEGKRLSSSKITIGMAKKEGWYQKSGSKWQTMPEQMLRYRAASFLGRIYAPDILMGMQSTEEVEDVYAAEPKDVTPVSKLSEAIAKKKEEVEKSEKVEEAKVIEVSQEEIIFGEESKDDIAYSAALGSIEEAVTKEYLQNVMQSINMDLLPVEKQDNLIKAAKNKEALILKNEALERAKFETKN